MTHDKLNLKPDRREPTCKQICNHETSSKQSAKAHSYSNLNLTLQDRTDTLHTEDWWISNFDSRNPVSHQFASKVYASVSMLRPNLVTGSFPCSEGFVCRNPYRTLTVRTEWYRYQLPCVNGFVCRHSWLKPPYATRYLKSLTANYFNQTYHVREGSVPP